MRRVGIDDFRKPIRSEYHKKRAQRANDDPVLLTTGAVLAAARSRAGLKDFGESGFEERLSRWIQTLKRNKHCTMFGKQQFFELCVGFATTRLRLREVLRRYPEIEAIRIEKPIIVLGLGRAGSTHLHRLLAADPRLRSVKSWEVFEPVPAWNELSSPRESDPRIIRFVDNMQQTAMVLPLTRLMFQQNAEDADEDFKLQGADFAECLWDTTFLDLAHGDRAVSSNEPHYGFLKLMLKTLRWQQGPDRWVLKSPEHALHLESLLAAFPDATIVMTHRDPIAVVQSALTLVGYNARRYYDEVQTEALAEAVVRIIDQLLHASVYDRRVIHEGQLVDIFFHEFMTDKIGTIEKIYGSAGLTMGPREKQIMTRFLDDNPRYKDGRVIYDMHEFGVDSETLRERWSFYYDKFPINIERP